MKLKTFGLVVTLVALAAFAWAGPTPPKGSYVRPSSGPDTPFADGTTVGFHLGSPGPYVNGIRNGADKWTYTSSQPAVATVDAATGAVTPVAVGKTIITAVSKGSATTKYSYTFTVKGAGDYAVGDFGPSGLGRVFYVSADKAHGLEIAPRGWKGVDDAKFQVAWKAAATESPNAAGTAVGSGAANSAALATDPSAAAAAACKAYAGGGKTDWFLPSIDELLLAVNAGFVDPPLPTSHYTVIYWSSSQADAGKAFGVDLGSPSGFKVAAAKTQTCFVRPVRAF